MELALNNLQRLICHKPQQPTNLLYTQNWRDREESPIHGFTQ